jgi:hypothetical protein
MGNSDKYAPEIAEAAGKLPIVAKCIRFSLVTAFPFL